MADGDEQKVVYDVSSTDKTSPKKQHALPAYALYKLSINSSTDTTKAAALELGSANYSICTDDSTTTSFCLTVVCTSLSSEREMQLKNTVARKLCKGSLLYSKGNTNTIEFSGEGDSNECQASYYHCLLKQETSTGTDQLPDEEKGQDDSRQFLICFIHATELHLFKAELDKYSTDLLSYIDSMELQCYLEGWWATSTRYLAASVRTLGDNLKYLIYLALLDAELDVVCSDDQLKADIISFLDCCSLAELLNNLTVDRTTDSSPSLTDSIPVTVNTSAQTATMPETQTPAVTLHINGATCQISSHECNQFCEEWASTLMTGDVDNPEFIRQVIENYRLKAIQDMNTLKRLLRQAETDYYSLFRCSVFLGQCGNSTVLLRHATLETDGRDRGVISILHCHLLAGSSKSS